MSDPRDPAASIAYAEAFARWGVGTVELHRTGRLKVPVQHEWQRSATTSPDVIRTRIERQGGQYGLKVREGSDVIGLDIDRPDLFPWVLLPEGALLVTHGPERKGTGPGKCHAWVRLPEGSDPMVVPARQPWGEVASVRQRQLVGPGSLHADGTLYRVVSGELPDELPELEPQAVVELLGASEGPSDRPPPDAGDWQWSPGIGSRHPLLVSRVRKWRGDGLGRDALRANLDDYLERHAIPLTHEGRTITTKELDDVVAWAFGEVPEDEPEVTAGELVVESTGLATIARLGRRELRIRQMSDMRVHVAAYVDGEPAAMLGDADIGTVARHHALASHLTSAESPQLGGSWLPLVIAAYAKLERDRPVFWRSGVALRDGEHEGIRYALHPYLAWGKPCTLMGHQSRLKSHTIIAWALALLTGRGLYPGAVVTEGIDHYVHVAYEGDAGTPRQYAREILAGAGIDADEHGLDGRFHVLAEGVPPLSRLADELIRYIDRLPSRADGRPLRILLVIDSATSAAHSLTQQASGDAWGAVAGALYKVSADVRRVTGLSDLMTVVLDHAGGERPPDIDDEFSWSKLRTYGSRQKDQISRAVWRIGKFEVSEYGDEYLMRVGAVKDWDNAAPVSDSWVTYAFDPDTGALGFRDGQRAAHRTPGRYPERIKPDSVAAGVFDTFLAEGHEEYTAQGEPVTVYPELSVTKLAELSGRSKQAISASLKRHPRVFEAVTRGRYRLKDPGR